MPDPYPIRLSIVRTKTILDLYRRTWPGLLPELQAEHLEMVTFLERQLEKYQAALVAELQDAYRVALDNEQRIAV